MVLWKLKVFFVTFLVLIASSKLMISLKHQYINGFLDSRRVNFTKAVISESYFTPKLKDINKILYFV